MILCDMYFRAAVHVCQCILVYSNIRRDYLGIGDVFQEIMETFRSVRQLQRLKNDEKTQYIYIASCNYTIFFVDCCIQGQSRRRRDFEHCGSTSCKWCWTGRHRSLEKPIRRKGRRNRFRNHFCITKSKLKWLELIENLTCDYYLAPYPPPPP